MDIHSGTEDHANSCQRASGTCRSGIVVGTVVVGLIPVEVVRCKIDELAALVHPRDEHPKIFAMIDAYLDESGIHDGAQICVIAGYFGGKGQMRKLDAAWKATLRDFDFPMADFHAKSWVKLPEHLPMLRELARVIGQQRKVHPVSYGIIVDDFYSFTLAQRRFLTGATLHPRTHKLTSNGCPTKPYFVPFQNIVRLIADYAPVGGKAHFNFGLNEPFAKSALALFKQIIKQSKLEPRPWSTWKSVDRLGTPLFPLASETAPLQAADLLVHLTYLHMNEWKANKKIVKQSPFLTECLQNSRSNEDHSYQNRKCLQRILEQSRQIVPDWDK